MEDEVCFVTQHGDGNMRSMLELLTDEGRTHILLQHYIPEIREGDKRIILIDGEARGWMNRVPGEGDHRGNMHVGATVQATELSDRDREICDAIGPWLKESGLLFVGIDTIGQFMTEINVTSPTGIQEINRLMGTRWSRTSRMRSNANRRRCAAEMPHDKLQNHHLLHGPQPSWARLG